jgi:hypothetical protein
MVEKMSYPPIFRKTYFPLNDPFGKANPTHAFKENIFSCANYLGGTVVTHGH